VFMGKEGRFTILWTAYGPEIFFGEKVTQIG
jgi:hypothetical protein